MSQAHAHVSAMLQAPPPAGDVTRLDRWLGITEEAPARFVPITPELLKTMKPEDILKLTMSNLALMGQSEIDLILKLLPESHSLRRPKTFRPMPLRKMPYLGSCKVGEVIVREHNGKYLVNQIYMANFEADLDTSGQGDLFHGITREVCNKPRMYYGLNVVVDRVGQALGFDRTAGNDGIAFQTNDKAEAVWQIAAASTHQTVEQLRAKRAPRR